MEGADKEKKKAEGLFLRLVELVSVLRSDEGCPWDRKQTEKDVKGFLIEEVYELIEAIDREDIEEIKEEIGDVVLLCVFLARIYEEKGIFDIKDSLSEVVDKLIRRHPHVFGDERIDDADEVIRNWAKIKEKEKEAKGKKTGIWASIPRSMPSLFQFTVLLEELKKRQKSVPIDEGLARVQLSCVAEDRLDDVDYLCGLILYGAYLIYVKGGNPEDCLRDYLRNRFLSLE